MTRQAQALVEILKSELPEGAATQTTLAAILAKIIAAPATEATLEAARALLAGTLDVAVTGSIPEYQWLSTDTPPALGAGDRAFGMEINAVTHAITVKYWTGAAWQEVA